MADAEKNVAPVASRRRGLSLATKAAVCGCALCLLAVGSMFVVARWTGDITTAAIGALVVSLPVAVVLVRRMTGPALAMFRALSGTVASYRDGDFAFGLIWKKRDELGELVEAHNALGDTLRDQRLSLIQRELLLDTMVQNTPVAMLLFDASRHVVYANLTARKLLNDGRRMEGLSQQDLFKAAPEPMKEAIERGGDGLFEIPSADADDDIELYFLSRRGFRLNGREHELFVLRRLTSELRRQEVRTWKKVIRVISHELNNSLAPIASLAHSGAELVRRDDTSRLATVFETIAERASHLEGFIRGYARFAKLPAPRIVDVDWSEMFAGLHSQLEFSLAGAVPSKPGRFDRAQIEQALVNLIRNAHESGSPPDQVTVHIRPRLGALAIEIADRGPGMSEAVLENALLPFYSTKRGGTGLGLALVREIAEAHGGRVSLSNRDGGGLVVALVLPS